MTILPSSLQKYRPTMGYFSMSLAAAAIIIALFNQTFWRKTFAYLEGDFFATAALVLAGIAMFTAIFTLVSFRPLFKPVLVLFFLSASSSAWFMDQFGTLISTDMIQNVAQTKWAEAQHLVSFAYVLHIALTGIVPSLAVLLIRVEPRGFWSGTMWNSLTLLFCVGVFTLAGLSHYRTYPSLFRGHKELVRFLNPVAPMASAVKYATRSRNDGPMAPLGMDARIVYPQGDAIGKPRVAIIVAGETARAQNFSLSGYERPTNPLLEKKDILYFSSTASCGTATAVSLPCMFSIFPRSDYSEKKFFSVETLPDVLAHAGLKIEWWENNTGSKGVADRVAYIDIPSLNDPRFCSGGECQDGLMLDMLDGWLDTIDKDSVLVLHHMGSHGPAYYQRYPEEFRRFTPDCRTGGLNECKPEEIVNAYDNTILYTDYFLATIIEKLKSRSDTMATAMFYMSDHGESLGESGIYLHGMPYLLAPSQQKEIPFIYWSDANFDRSMALDKSCLAAKTEKAYSHDNLFHSILGMMNVKTEIYDPALDIFSGCKNRVILQTPVLLDKGGKETDARFTG